jgi:hypothetical protein
MGVDIQKKQKQREQRLVRRLVEGLVGWLTFRQAAGAKTLYSEYFLYPPIYEIASGRRWSVLAQEPIKNSMPGAPSTLDFVFYEKADNRSPDRRGLILMEVKYLRGENTTNELRGLQEDFTKLRAVTRDGLRNARSLAACGTPSKWQIIVAQREAYEKLSKSKSNKFPRVTEMLATALADNPPRLVYRSVIETKLKSQFHWHVIAIGEERWPFHSAQKS